MTPSVLYCDFGGVLTPPVADAFCAVARAAAVAPALLRTAMAQVSADLGMGTSTEPLELGVISQHDWGLKVTAALGPDAIPQVPLTDFGDYWYDGREINAALSSCRPKTSMTPDLHGRISRHVHRARSRTGSCTRGTGWRRVRSGRNIGQEV